MAQMKCLSENRFEVGERVVLPITNFLLFLVIITPQNEVLPWLGRNVVTGAGTIRRGYSQRSEVVSNLQTFDAVKDIHTPSVYHYLFHDCSTLLQYFDSHSLIRNSIAHGGS
jgi:hypothetical protein